MEDFNIPSTERVALLEHLQEAMGGAPLYFWAACQVCDLKSLEDLVEIARKNPAIARCFATLTLKMILHWTQSTKGTSKTTTPKKRKQFDLGSSPAGSSAGSLGDSPRDEATSSPGLHRNGTATNLAKQRDNFCCVLTGDIYTDVAHIYPFYSLQNEEEDIFGARHTFWDLLRGFWPKEKVAAWEAELFPRGIHEIGIERVYNLITLSPVAHRCWNRGAFALKPISLYDNNTTLKVQFFWQKKQKDTQATMSLPTMPFSTEDLDHNEGALDTGKTQLFDWRTDKRIKSGQFFELRTNDSIERPLPSFKLLEMQWFLQRVVGMAGAAGPYDDEDWLGEDSDEEIFNPGLGEVEDDSFADPIQPGSPQSLRKDNLLRSKHHVEEAEGDRLQVI